jgi:sn-glycerol 3-phosphate transport system ATP-binding protein
VAGFIGSPAMNLVPGAFGGGCVTIGSDELPIDDRIDNAVRRRPVLVGLRPEHLEAAPAGPIALRIELLERLGADTIVHGRLDGSEGVTIAARGPGTFSAQLGEIQHFAIHPDHIHLFDPDSGRRLG